MCNWAKDGTTEAGFSGQDTPGRGTPISSHHRRHCAWINWLALVCLIQFTITVAAAPAQGKVAPADVVSPVPLEVVNPEKTETLRLQAAAKIPAIYRFDPKAVTQSEAALRQRFSNTRAHFWQTMEQAARRPTLDPATVQHPSFLRFLNWFREQEPGFPLTSDLAQAWALREADDPILDQWVERLRATMNHCVVSDGPSDEIPSGASLVRVVSAPASDEPLTLKGIQKDGVTLRASDLVTLAQAKIRLQSVNAADPQNVGAFLAGFLRENCQAEPDLTRALRQKAVAHILAVDRYEAGQVIVRRGEQITNPIQAALDLLNTEVVLEKSALEGSASAGAREDPSFLSVLKQAWRRTVSAPLQFEKMALISLFLLALFSLLATFFLAWLVRRRRVRNRPSPVGAPRDVSYAVVLNSNQKETVFLPLQPSAGAKAQVQNETVSQANAPGASVVEASDRFWHQRAVEAERRAEEILGLVRAGLAPQLARQMMHKLVQELIAQRAGWLQTQRLAEHDLAEIERRFTTAHGDLVNRLRAFEKRTEELEKALALKAEENSHLIQSHIAITQNQIKSKETTQETIWN